MYILEVLTFYLTLQLYNQFKFFVKLFFLIETIAITEKYPSPISMASIVRATNSFIKLMQLINPSYP